MRNRVLLLGFLVTFTLNSQILPSYIPSDSLIAWFPFNGNANDESGNGNHGTVYLDTSIGVTGATLTIDRVGDNNSAYQFNGTTDYIYGTLNGFSNTSISTVSAWLLYIGDAGGRPYDLYFQYGQYGSHTFAYGYNFISKKFDLFSNCFSNPYSSVNIDSAWHHLVVVDSMSTTKVYLDGSLFTSFSSGGNNNCYNNSNSFLIGGGADEQYVTGKVDDIGVWNRALTAAEINDLFNSCEDSIQVQPISNSFQTVPGIAHFTSTHSDTEASYQWQENHGTGWTNLNDFGIYSGTNTDSLVLTGITTSLNNYGYRCLIQACTMDTTNVAYLTVDDNVSVEEIVSDLRVLPNPSYGNVYISLNSVANYKVYKLTGKLVAEGKTKGKIDLTNLPAGTYTLLIDSEEEIRIQTIQKL